MGNKCACRIKFPSANPDSSWRIQHALMRKHPVYHFVDLNMGGSLLQEPSPPADITQVASASDVRAPVSPAPGVGADRVRQIAIEQIADYLYKYGEGEITDKSIFRKWHEQLETYVQNEPKHVREQFYCTPCYEEDNFNKFKPHRACWDVAKRGWMGETPLHLCFVMNTPEHIRVSRILLDQFPDLALDVFEGREYFGESALHIAVVNGDLESVKLLVRCGADVHQRATGYFFRPEDQKKNPQGRTSYKGEAYLGEYPLSFAASKGDIAIYDFLLEHGADPDLQDSFGNTVLHMAVLHDQPEMFRHAALHPVRPVKLTEKNERNNRRVTPLTLACRLGHSRMFKLFLELGSVDNWQFGPATCRLYPLITLDSVGMNGETDWGSALWQIVKGETDEHLEMLEVDVVKQLLQEKWATYGKRRFAYRLTWAILHVLFIMAALYFRPEGSQLANYRDSKDGTRAPAQTVYLFSCLLILLCVPFRVARMDVVEDALLMFAIPGAWFFLLFFARGLEWTGPFVIMIYKMLIGDFFRFSVMYIIFLVGFTTGFYVLFRHLDAVDEDIQKSYSSVGDVVLSLIMMTVGDFQYEAFDSSKSPTLAKLVFCVFMILMSLLLLQMLIAMMTNTYNTVISRAEKEWRRQWATTVLVLERTSFRKETLLSYTAKYSKVLYESSCPPYPYTKFEAGRSRGLMVISIPKDSADCEEKSADTS